MANPIPSPTSCSTCGAEDCCVHCGAARPCCATDAQRATGAGFATVAEFAAAAESATGKPYTFDTWPPPTLDTAANG